MTKSLWWKKSFFYSVPSTLSLSFGLFSFLFFWWEEKKEFSSQHDGMVYICLLLDLCVWLRVHHSSRKSTYLCYIEHKLRETKVLLPLFSYHLWTVCVCENHLPMMPPFHLLPFRSHLISTMATEKRHLHEDFWYRCSIFIYVIFIFLVFFSLLAVCSGFYVYFSM